MTAYCREVSPRTPLSPNYQIISDRRGPSALLFPSCALLDYLLTLSRWPYRMVMHRYRRIPDRPRSLLV
jgi:hypothetical protein